MDDEDSEDHEDHEDDDRVSTNKMGAHSGDTTKYHGRIGRKCDMG